MKFLTCRQKTAAVLILLWLGVTALNLTKAVHIDDTAHLEITKNILHNPLHPMSGKLNWGNTAEPIYRANQPPLLFYLFALVMAVCGESELALHLLLSGFSLGAILFCYFLAARLAPKHALFLTAAFCFAPVFIPAQNLMSDVPLVSLWLAFFWAIFSPREDRQASNRYLLAAVFAATACLIKYPSLILLPILLLHIVLKKKWQQLWTAAVPIMVLMGWSLFNYFDYGGFHILGRVTPPLELNVLQDRMIAWLIGLGAIFPLSVIYIPYLTTQKNGRFLLVGSLLLTASLALQSLRHLHESTTYFFLQIFFLGNGVVALGAALYALAERFRESEADEKINRLTLFFWLSGGAAFIILFSPFMAVRHFIIIIPAMLLLTSPIIARAQKGWRCLGLAMTMTLGLLLGISDWTFAEMYRVQAGRIQKKLATNKTIWYTGHWGWQWYASKAGMKQYDTRQTILHEGDYLVIPQLSHKQEIAPRHLPLLKKVDEIVVEATPADFIRIMSNAPWGGYYVFWTPHSLPWTISTAPVEKFEIFIVAQCRDTFLTEKITR